MRGNNIPGTPFVAIVDTDRNVLAAGAVHNVEQIEFLLDLGRRFISLEPIEKAIEKAKAGA